MATKSEMVEYIENHSVENESWGDLNRMKKSEVEQIYDYLIKVVEQQNSIEGDAGLEYGEHFEEDTIIGGIEDEKPEPVDEYVEHKKPSELSISEQRAYARTGILPVKKK